MEKIKKILIVYKHSFHPEHLHTLKLIKKELKGLGLSFKLINRKKIKIHHEDLIITVGGDGTLLRTAHRLKKIPILGVNSTPSQSVGALCGVTAKNFSDKIKKIFKGKIEPVLISRLQVKVNSHFLPILAVNEILYAHVSPAGMSRYVLKIGRKKEEQKSSGIWVATPAGSTAAIRAAGGKVLPLTSKKYEFLVREPYVQKNKKFKMTHGILKSNQAVTIINKTKSASLFMDGMKITSSLNFGDKITIKISSLPLHIYRAKRGPFFKQTPEDARLNNEAESIGK